MSIHINFFLNLCEISSSYMHMNVDEKWNLQMSGCEHKVKIELRPVLTEFMANLLFPTLRMLLSDL